MIAPSRAQLLAGLLVAVAAGAAALYITRPPAPTAAPPGTPDQLSSAEITTILEPDAIQSVDHPRFVAAGTAGVRANSAVIGVDLGGEAHAYPIAFMSRVEIVNDRLGGTNIAITW